jgi:Txe/YoeB family toxin of Txe-Axe toxin-antitoxin module
LYKILDVLEAFGHDQVRLNTVSVHGNVKPLQGKNKGLWEARLSQEDRILYQPLENSSILIKDVWGHT